MKLYKLQQNDKVNIIAPSSRCDVKILDELKTLLSKWNLSPHIPPDIFDVDLLSANKLEVRYQQLLDALYDTDSHVIWCLRGGYGAGKLIPLLANIEPPKQTKIFIGFSDITALHIFLQQKWGWTTIHGPSAHQAAANKVDSTSLIKLQDILFQTQDSLVYDNLIAMNQAALVSQHLNGTIIGGNLSLIQASIGTAWQINCENKILLLEEINERGYRVDRMLEHLKQAGILKNLSALLIGDFIGGEEKNGKPVLETVLNDFALQCHFPVLRIPNVGHGDFNHPVLFNYPSELITGEQNKLLFRFFSDSRVSQRESR